MGSLSRKQADKLKYMEYLIKDKQTLYVFLTEEDFFFPGEQPEFCFKAMIILLQTFQQSSLRSYKAAANRDAQLHQGELLNCICLSELQTLTFSCLRVIIKGQSDT